MDNKKNTNDLVEIIEDEFEDELPISEYYDENDYELDDLEDINESYELEDEYTEFLGIDLDEDGVLDW